VSRAFGGAARMIRHTGYMLSLLAWSLVLGLARHHGGRGFRRLVEQLHVQMVKSLGVVTVVALFMGMIVALQTGVELDRFGIAHRLGAVVGASMAREMGPFITGIILTATVGAAIAAELGTMRVSEEIDALELMNVDPRDFLIAPRIIALGMTAILLTVWVDVIGMVGGAIVAQNQFGVTFAQSFETAREVFQKENLLGFLSKDIYTGLVKAFVFGLFIGALSCAAGMRAKGGALGVGRAVRSSVVASVLVVLILGYLMTWMFWA
jgi:phospholipid/cholesterol/gamma-HCH transport system permease protein